MNKEIKAKKYKKYKTIQCHRTSI